MSVKAGEALCYSQACWAMSDFNTSQSCPQHEWRLQCCFFPSCSFFRGCLGHLSCVQRHCPSPIKAPAAAHWCSETQPRPQDSRSPCWEGEPESWNYSTWILARNTRVKKRTLQMSYWDLMWQSPAGCLFSISSMGQHIQPQFPILKLCWDFCSGLTQRKWCHSMVALVQWWITAWLPPVWGFP